MNGLAKLQFKLSGILVFCSIAAAAAAGWVFLRAADEKLAARAAQEHLSRTIQVSSWLESAIAHSAIMALPDVESSREVIFAFDSICSPDGLREGISNHYRNQFGKVGRDPREWARTLDLFRLCSTQDKELGKVQILPSTVQIGSPHLLVLHRREGNRRLVMLSLEALAPAGADGWMLLDSFGRPLWSPLGLDAALSELKARGLSQERLTDEARVWLKTGAPTVERSASRLELAWSRLGENLVLLSWGESQGWRAAWPHPARWTMLGLGVLFLMAVLASRLVAGILGHPLRRLTIASDALAAAAAGRTPNGAEAAAWAELESVAEPWRGLAGSLRSASDALRARMAELEKARLDTEARLLSELKKRDEARQPSRATPPPAPPDKALAQPRIVTPSLRFQVYNQPARDPRAGIDWWICLELPRDGAPPLSVLAIGDVLGDTGTAEEVVRAGARPAELVREILMERPQSASDPRQLLHEMNRRIFSSEGASLSTTAFVAAFDPAAGVLKCCNAGQNLPYLLLPDRDGETAQVKAIGRSGTPLGFSEDTRFTEIDSYRWTSGCRLFLYTDGLINADRRDESRSFDRRILGRALARNALLSGGQMLETVIRERTEAVFVEQQREGATAIVYEASGDG